MRVVVVLLVIGFIALVAFSDHDAGAPSPTARSAKIADSPSEAEWDAIWRCQQAVKRAAKFPSKVDFPWRAPRISSPGSAGGYLIAGSAEMMNGIGNMVPAKYGCSDRGGVTTVLYVEPG